MNILIFVILAAICNGIMDTIKHHWYRSVFNFARRGIKFREWLWRFFHQMSWQLAYDWEKKMEMGNILGNDSINFPYVGNWEMIGRRVWFTILGYKIRKPLVDGWHFFKSLMIMLILLPYALWDQVIVIGCWNSWLLDWFVLGLAWNIPFNAMYNKILIKKNYR